MNRSLRTAALMMGLFLAVPSYGQGFRFPEKSSNLQVLPADTSPDDLRAVMQGFTRALGLRCANCHVGEEGQPLSAFDFASDDRPLKNVARIMMRMTRTINEESLASLGRPDVLRVTCETCHRGAPRPTTLRQELSAAHAESGVPGVMERYRVLHERYFGSNTYDFRPASLEGFAAQLQADGQTADAIATYRFIIEQYPASAGGHAGLGQALYAQGDRDGARAAFEAALAIDPEHRGARAGLSRLDSNN